MEKVEQRIKERVEAQLKWDDRIKKSDIKVDVTGTTVKLEGTVPSYIALRAAESNVYMIEGVTLVENSLHIKYPEGTQVPQDMEIESNIRNMLLWDGSIDSSNIEIIVDQGMVTLNGTVLSQWERKLAEDIAFSAKGVNGVNNNLVVNLTADINDQIIADEIRDAIDRNPIVNSNEIEILVDQGMVTIRGNVQSYIEANAAHDAVMYTTGVRGIVDQLNIG